MMSDEDTPYCTFILHSKLDEFRSDGKYSDVNIRVRDRIFKCHRVVLASAAKYFDSMLGGCFKEGRTEDINMQDIIDPAAFDTILECVYSGRAPAVDEGNVLNVLRASDFLGIGAIKDCCVTYILENVQSISALEAFGIAYAQNNVKLLDSLGKFIVRHLETYVNKGMFLDIQYQELNHLLNQYRSSSSPFVSEDFILDALIRWVYYSSEERKDHFAKLLEMIDFKRISTTYLEFMKEKYKVDAQVFEASSSNQVLEDGSLFRKAVIDSLMLHTETAADSSNISSIFFKDPQFTNNTLTLHACCKSNESRQTTYCIFSMDKSKAKPEWYRSCTFYKRNLRKYELSIKGLATLEEPNYLYTYEEDCVYMKGWRWLFNAYSSINFSSKPHATLTSLPFVHDTLPQLVGAGKRIYLYEANPRGINWSDRIKDEVPGFSKDEYERGIYYYNCDLDKWFPVPGMKNKVSYSYLFSDHKLVYLIGGKDSNNINRPHYVQAYDYRVPQWLEIPNTLTSPHGEPVKMFGRSTPSCCAANGKIYLANYDLIQAFDPAAFKWETIKEYASGDGNREMVIAADNDLLWVFQYLPRREFHIYDLASLEWLSEISIKSFPRDMYFDKYLDIVVFKPLAQ